MEWVGVNFALILFCLSVFTGAFWLADLFVFKKQREQAYAKGVVALEERIARLGEQDRALQRQVGIDGLQNNVLKQPWWLEFTASFFPVIAVVFFLRSFIVEPFKIPSGSMIPTLQIGDFILVNNMEYIEASAKENYNVVNTFAKIGEIDEQPVHAGEGRAHRTPPAAAPRRSARIRPRCGTSRRAGRSAR